MRWTLGAKLTAWSALVVGAALLICGVGASLFIQQEQIEALDDQLHHEAHLFFGAFEWMAKHTAEPHAEDLKAILPDSRMERVVQVTDAHGRNLFISQTVRQWGLPALGKGMHTVKMGKSSVRLGVFVNRGVTLSLGAELSEINADASHLMFGFSIVLPLLIALVAGGGWLLARKALAPIREMAIAAEQITAERLDQRLPRPRTRDEVGRLTEVLNAMFDRLEASFHQAMRFSADASHELKTPLTVLRAGIEDLLESPTLSEADQGAVSGLLEQTRRLTSITQSLLLLARADAGRLQLDLCETDAVEIITACVDDARIMAEDRRIEIEANLPAWLHARLDAGRFPQILLNLLENAVKYNWEDGRIVVTAERAGSHVLVTVENTGPGVPPESAPKLFERFYRSDPQVGTHGHGLGLSLARELALAHGGDLVLTRADAAATVFTLRLLAAGPAELPVEGSARVLALR